MGAWGAAGLLAVWLASAMAEDTRSGPRLEDGSGRRHVTARSGTREGERRRPPATSRRRTRKTARAAAHEADGGRRATRRLDSPPAAGSGSTAPASGERTAANARLTTLRTASPGARVENGPTVRGVPSMAPGSRLPPG